ncbi:mechanosensitive ion channel [Candidatus Berkelbacteria bacterium]|nr:mechanosensitive ion channel [Candidatus Berkelbacteria bacterium]
MDVFKSLEDSILLGVEKLPGLLLTFVVGFIIIRIARSVLRGVVGATRANVAMRALIINIIDIALWIFLFAALLQQMGFVQISYALSGSVALGAIAISIGSSSFVQDIVSGIFLAQDTDFGVGDTIKINDITGEVEKMDARKVRLRDKSGELHIFPNSSFDKSHWTVIKRSVK